MERAVASDPVSPLAYIEPGKVLLWARQFEALRRPKPMLYLERAVGALLSPFSMIHRIQPLVKGGGGKFAASSLRLLAVVVASQNSLER